MKKVLVTGANGFIGNYVIRELLSAGCQVIATSRSMGKAQTKDWYSRVSFIECDFGDISNTENYFEYFQKPDLLIHLAWDGLPDYKSRLHVDNYLPQHFQLLRNLVVNGLKDITVTGTCLEYGLKEGVLTEEMNVQPNTSYGIAKHKLSLFLNELTETTPFDLKWIRLFYMYGKGQNTKSLLSQLEIAIQEGNGNFNMSPGDQLRDFLPVEKVAEIIVKIALQNNVLGIINCCSGKPISVKNFVLKYLKKNNKTIHLNLGYYPYPDYEPKDFWGDTTKLNTIIKNDRSNL